MSFRALDLVYGPGPDLLVSENPFHGGYETGIMGVSMDGETWTEGPCAADDADGGANDYGGIAGGFDLDAMVARNTAPRDAEGSPAAPWWRVSARARRSLRAGRPLSGERSRRRVLLRRSPIARSQRFLASVDGAPPRCCRSREHGSATSRPRVAFGAERAASERGGSSLGGVSEDKVHLEGTMGTGPGAESP